jgi:beta-N-acetylhexosaminidase
LTLADGKADQSALAEIQQYGVRVGARLRELGINVNFAPVVDLLTEPRNTAIGDRCFGQTPETVSARAGAFLAGIQSQDVWGCLKHFPGQGHAYIDTHLGQAVVDLPLNLLENRELLPFIHLKDQAAMIMVAHCIYPKWSKLEASRSPEIMNDLLRTKLGFNGLIVTDDMLMGAIPQTEQEWSQAIVDSVAAGADLVLVCKDLSRAQLAYSALKEAESRSPEFKQRLAQAAAKVLRLRRSRGASDLG